MDTESHIHTLCITNTETHIQTHEHRGSHTDSRTHRLANRLTNTQTHIHTLCVQRLTDPVHICVYGIYTYVYTHVCIEALCIWALGHMHVHIHRQIQRLTNTQTHIHTHERIDSLTYSLSRTYRLTYILSVTTV